MIDPIPVAIDFDGTIVEHEYPKIGKPVPHAIRVMKRIVDHNHKIILFTMRSGMRLALAVSYLKKQGIEVYGVNHNPDQAIWTDSPKAYGHIYIDDSALGCPLIQPKAADVSAITVDAQRPYVDWLKVERMLELSGVLTALTEDEQLLLFAWRHGWRHEMNGDPCDNNMATPNEQAAYTFGRLDCIVGKVFPIFNKRSNREIVNDLNSLIKALNNFQKNSIDEK